jgi:hypothetical protein
MQIRAESMLKKYALVMSNSLRITKKYVTVKEECQKGSKVFSETLGIKQTSEGVLRNTQNIIENLG